MTLMSDILHDMENFDRVSKTSKNNVPEAENDFLTEIAFELEVDVRSISPKLIELCKRYGISRGNRMWLLATQ